MTNEAQKPAILLVEDDDSLREVLQFNIEDAGFEVTAVSRGGQALAVYDPDRHDVVLTDLKMPGIDGLTLLERLRTRHPKAVVLLMTAYGTLEVAVSAMQAGAFHYVEKPVNTPTLIAMLHRAVEFAQLGREKSRLEGGRDHTIISTSPAMNNLLRVVDKVADSDATILIRGESGTGKELVARAIHDRSGRRHKPFIPVNCSAIPDTLLESVLFGHERGAFTGAVKASPGKFATAEGGTLFLDEIGEMSPDLQAKLLRVLQDGEVEPVGSDRSRLVDVRVVAATHRDVLNMTAEGTFREDLFYRLNVIPLIVPPLRQRPEDIPVLFRHFLRRHGERPVAVARAVDIKLAAYGWPGNVRELENIAKRMVLLAESDRLGVDDLPEVIRVARARPTGLPSSGLPFDLPPDGLELSELVRRVIFAVLEMHDWNQSASARYLGMPRHKLLYRMETYGLQRRKETPAG